MIQPPGRPVPFDRFIVRLIGQPNLTLGLAAFLLGLLGNVLAGALGGWAFLGISGNVWILIVIALAVIALYGLYRFRMPKTKIEMRENAPTAKAGLILLLSTLDPRARGTKVEVARRIKEVQAVVDRILSSDTQALSPADVESLCGTNLEPALRALEFHYHEGTLRECWLIGTPDERRDDGSVVKGSAGLGTVLARWFGYLHPDHRVDFHTSYEVAPRDYVKLWDTVDSIFRAGPLRADAILCDITGGQKLMSIGAALACLGDGRTMQYMAVDRDWKGEPIPQGEMKPVLIDINPYLIS